MATASFDRTFVIDSQEAADKILAIMNSDKSVPKNTVKIDREEMKKNGELLKKCFYH